MSPILVYLAFCAVVLCVFGLANVFVFKLSAWPFLLLLCMVLAIIEFKSYVAHVKAKMLLKEFLNVLETQHEFFEELSKKYPHEIELAVYLTALQKTISRTRDALVTSTTTIRKEPE